MATSNEDVRSATFRSGSFSAAATEPLALKGLRTAEAGLAGEALAKEGEALGSSFGASTCGASPPAPLIKRLPQLLIREAQGLLADEESMQFGRLLQRQNCTGRETWTPRPTLYPALSGFACD